MLIQNIQAEAAVPVDIRMVHARCELDTGRPHGVVGRELDGEEENAAIVRSVGRTEDGPHPVGDVVTCWPSTIAAWRVPLEVL
jgi:hypothetical protein